MQHEPLSRDTALQLYKSLFLARRSEEYIIKHYHENQMRTPMHMSMGQEFVSVGVCAALEGTADVFASYRSHAAFLAQTHDTDRFFAELYGRTYGTGEGKSGSMHLAAPDQGHILSSGVVATQIPVAVGAAFANKQLNTGRMATVFFGDGAADAGVFYESVNIAGLYNLPMLFVCEDNEYAVDTPRNARQTSLMLSHVVRQFNVSVYEDNSGDVESVYSLVKHAANVARISRQPAFLNVKCCRYLEHVGVNTDWNWGYRSQEEVQRKWIDRDALKTQRAKLLSHGMGEEEIVNIENEIDARIKQSVSMAAQAPIPTSDRLHVGVFHEKA